jgi:hypothetical protein
MGKVPGGLTVAGDEDVLAALVVERLAGESAVERFPAAACALAAASS